MNIIFVLVLQMFPLSSPSFLSVNWLFWWNLYLDPFSLKHPIRQENSFQSFKNTFFIFFIENAPNDIMKYSTCS